MCISLSDKLDRIQHWPGPSTHVAWTGYSIDVDRPTHVAWTRYSIDVDRPTHVAWTGFTRQLYIAVYFLIYVVHKLSTFTALHRGGGGVSWFFFGAKFKLSLSNLSNHENIIISFQRYTLKREYNRQLHFVTKKILETATFL